MDKRGLRKVLKDLRGGASARQLRHRYRLTDRTLLGHLINARRERLITDGSLWRILAHRTQYHFPSNPETRLKAVLSCMNSELKQATLLVIDKTPMTGTAIEKRLADLTDARLPPRAFYAYGVQTLCPAGFVIHEIFGKGLRIRYNCFKLSNAGDKCGQPIAAFSLRYAVDHNLSLYHLLGPATAVGESRAPYNRARIMELLAEGCSRIVDLEARMGLDHTDINYHLNHLQRHGFVRFESLNPERMWKSYQWVEGRRPQEAKTVGMRRRLTEKVAHWLCRNRIGNPAQIARNLNYGFKQDVSQILVSLAKQGLAHTQFPSSDRSVVTLGEKARIALDYLKRVRSALTDERELKRMKAVLEEFRREEDLFSHYVDRGVRLYCAISPRMNARKAEEREAELLNFIREYQDENTKGPRPSEMASGLGWNLATLRDYINSLLKKARLIREQKGTTVRYRLRE